ncbi:hypothetical protein BD560DRAFT_386103 [Blakeslea trispora]|nr:hypothetical protein BD560DRAFT_386103 [Blakeslea trispora]
MSWAQLPFEILQQITQILGRDLAQFRLTCRLWYLHAYRFPYQHFKVNSNVFEFANTLNQSPYHPGSIVKSITFTDDIVDIELDDKIRQAINIIFSACPNIESIHCSPATRALIWPSIIHNANKKNCLQRVKYVGEGSNMLTKYLKTDEESNKLYVQLMYALRKSITLLKLFNDGYNNLLPPFAGFRTKLHCFKALTALRLHGRFRIEELNAILDDCPTIRVFIIFSDRLKACIAGPMPSVPSIPHRKLKYVQIQNGPSQNMTDVQYILQKFQNLDSCILERIDMAYQNDHTLNLIVQQLILFGLQIKEFNVRFCHVDYPLHKLRTCLYNLEPSIPVFLDICFVLEREMSHVHINKRRAKASIYIAWDGGSVSLDDLSSLCDLCKRESVHANIHGKMTDVMKLSFLNSKIQNGVSY